MFDLIRFNDVLMISGFQKVTKAPSYHFSVFIQSDRDWRLFWTHQFVLQCWCPCAVPIFKISGSHHLRYATITFFENEFEFYCCIKRIFVIHLGVRGPHFVKFWKVANLLNKHWNPPQSLNSSF